MLRKYYIVTESLTMAMKGYRVLSKYMINARVERLTPSKTRRGCGYAIIIYDDPKKVTGILRNNNVRIKSIIEG